ncbi:MAG: ABC transporter permease, partial [Oscillospiraceae bacterium]|nr:ABC transporter permease [Oscillospiraceae bacterium]
MKTFDLIRMCLRNLFRRKFRTMLTVSGVVIGTCAIIVMISLGIAISKTQEELITSYGDLTLVQVWGYDPQNPLDDDALAEIQLLENVDTATPFMQYYEADSMSILAGKKGRYAMTSYYYINGVYPEALEKLGYEIKEGEYLPPTNPGKKIQILMGENAAYQFEDTKKSWQNNRVNTYPDESGNIPEPFIDPMKEEMTLELTVYGDKEKKLVYDVEVVGVMKGDPSKNYATMEGAFMSIKDMKRIQEDYNKLVGNKTQSSGRGRRRPNT